ncbi:MAG TPA: hypothetical protein VLG12_04755 [Candidatus Saccharimonadales bacterium]|nr:hypothetical protein [Candidatus Saccharimonadales bacterium]
MENVISLVVFRIHEGKLVVLLENKRLLTSPIVDEKDLDDIAKHVFSTVTKIALHKNYIEQLYTFFHKKALPAGRQEKEIAVVYYILLPENNIVLSENLVWQEVKSIGEGNSDFSIIAYALQRLRWKIEYTNVVYSLLPEMFTLSELQKVYEIILGQSLDKRNFRKKILSLDFLKATNEKRISNSRPAQMYRFKKREPQLIKIFS